MSSFSQSAMENMQESRTKITHQQNLNLNLKREQPQPNSSNPLVWDCDSNLYDSFELKSFERQLHSAIHSRTFSMPHVPDRRVSETKTTSVADPPPSFPPPPPSASRKHSKISRSLNKFLKSVFKSKDNSASLFRVKNRPGDEYYVAYDKSGALTSIPEVPEIDFSGFPREMNSLVRRSKSERFTETSFVGISRAY